MKHSIDERTLPRADDIYLSKTQEQIFQDVRKKIERVKRTIGYANFNIVSFDNTLKYARNYSYIGKFTKEELDFIEALFYFDPRAIGFYGKRTCTSLTQSISKSKLIKDSTKWGIIYLKKSHLIL